VRPTGLTYPRRTDRDGRDSTAAIPRLCWFSRARAGHSVVVEQTLGKSLLPKEDTMATDHRRSLETVDPTRVAVVRWLALITGGVFTVIGLAGFAVTGFDQFAEPTQETLLGFGVNPLHNIVHLALGIAGLAMGWKLATARIYGWLLVVGYGLVLLFGLIVDREDPANILNINAADNWLHLATVVVGLVIALLPVRRRAESRV
jgi:hypothetical protein